MSTCKDDRNLAHFKRDIWANYFTTFSLDTELLESYTKEVEKLKEEVKDELVAVGVKAVEKMILINSLERLGVYYLFTKEIEEQLHQIYANYDHDMNMDYDLCTTALHFRIFRQHAYQVSSDVFNKFKDTNGNFKETLKNDLNGILSLYEAAYLRVNGEDILEQALSFTKACLTSIEPTLSPFMGEQVKHALEQSLHRSVPRIEARKFISVYETDSLRNDKILRLAKVDFNRLQLLHKQELCQLSRWWIKLHSETPYARDRIVESFLWGTSVHFEPEYSLLRTLLTKAIGLLIIVDDSSDAYGTYDEFSAFNDAIQRWDSRAVNQIPTYLMPCLNEMFNLHDELEKELEEKGTSHFVHYSKEAFKEIMRAYVQELEWVTKGYVPSFNEYMACKLIISTAFMVILSFVGIGEVATPQAFEWTNNWLTDNEMLIASSIIGRLTNDLAGYEVEQQREHAATGVECYMKQYNVTEQEAINELNKMVEKAWITLNEETLRTTVVSKPLLMTVLNNTRVYTEIYKEFDRLTEPEGWKHHVTSLFVDPIPL